MRALFAILIICVLTFNLITSCKPPGLLCAEDKDCCAPLICNPWAGRCTKKLSTTTVAPPPVDSPTQLPESYVEINEDNVL
ncbi:hypothetical protein WH47_01793 [Habropoda laboriosa]|uniref:Granulins domain-containing protein n=1 Tax=Habropoda laboriosa TaxID=597456 RepID=A0A0L7QU67_9HYME|nr:PREDICTED: uncharacterized protein LOC108575382 [Habropoda laboriosa]KOC62001.1 hypothetical protein WH47_01793 [Habropoda laboriosa]